MSTFAMRVTYNVAVMCRPNFGAQNEAAKHYFRACGLALGAIATELAVQNPSTELAELLKKEKCLERLGVYSLSISGNIALSILISVAF